MKEEDEDEEVYDDSIEGKDDIIEEDEGETPLYDYDDDYMDDLNEDDYMYDEVTGKKKKKTSILNKRDITDEDYDEVFDLEE